MPTKQKVLLSEVVNNKQDLGPGFGNDDEQASMTLMQLQSSLASNPRSMATIQMGDDANITGIRTRSPSSRRASSKKARMSFETDLSEESSQSETAKEKIIGCKCVKSSCLKLYCTCFQKGSYCLDTCGCINCLNTSDNDGPGGTRAQTIQEILKRRPTAFEPKVSVAVTNSSPTIGQILGSDASSSSSPSHSDAMKPPAQRYRGAVRTKGVVLGCKCSKSKCLKLYCPCFEKGIVCNEHCSCIDCKNTTEESGPDGARTKAIEEVLSRRPLAFDKREGDTNDVGCICKKTKCLKKYCICFSAGFLCGERCRCRDCGNRGGGDEEEEEETEEEERGNEEEEAEEKESEGELDWMELKCVDTEPPLMLEDPTLQLLDVSITNYEEV